MKTLEEIKTIVAKCQYLDWGIVVSTDDGGRPYLQIHGFGPDAHTGVETSWTSAKHWLSYHMCTNEVVRTAYKAVRDAVLHELDEFFRYDETAVMNPHIDFDKLVYAMKIDKEGFVDVRKDVIKGV